MKFTKISLNILLQGFVIILLIIYNIDLINGQRSAVDIHHIDLYRSFRQFTLNLIGRSGNDARNLRLNKRLGNFQKEFSKDDKFFCDAKNGPGRRSIIRPDSVNKLHPGDIDIIMGMGDSLTAGNGIASTKLTHVLVENRGMSWSIGGQDTWHKYLTLPNILKEFNPNIYGYSLRDGLATERISRFNVAELGAMSRDMPYMAKVLVQRLKHDPNVNMTNDWKLLTMFIGSNDFCADMCYYPDPWIVVNLHEKDMLNTLRYLRDNVPRLMVSIVPAPNVDLLLNIKGKPRHCHSTNTFECPCFMGKPVETVTLNKKIIKEWIKKDYEVADKDEFHTNEFTVNVQPFTRNLKFPTLDNGLSDFRYFSMDCFHLSQKAHARSANAVWNNMLESNGEKYFGWHKEFDVFNCPTEERPYLATRENSKS